MSAPVAAVGFRSGLAAFAFTVLFVVVQLLQLAGAFRFPVDEILIYGSSLGIVVPFVLEMTALHHVTVPDRRFWTHVALVFTILYAVFVTANYAVQLGTVIPARLAGTAETIGVLEQTPHSMFWVFDALGYIAMGLAALFAIPAFGDAGFERGVRLSLLAHALTTPLIAVVYFAPTFSTKLLLLGLPWGLTAPIFMLMLALHMRRLAGPEPPGMSAERGLTEES